MFLISKRRLLSVSSLSPSSVGFSPDNAENLLQLIAQKEFYLEVQRLLASRFLYIATTGIQIRGLFRRTVLDAKLAARIIIRLFRGTRTAILLHFFQGGQKSLFH